MAKEQLIYQGEVIEEIDLPDDLPQEERLKIKQLAEKGILYNKTMHELGEEKRRLAEEKGKLSQVQEVLEKAKNDENYRKTSFIPNLENELGFKITESQADDLLDDISQNPIVVALQKKIDDLEKSQKTDQERQMIREIESAHKVLEGKYNGKNGMPKYDREEVDKYIAENSFFMPDINQNYEEAYFLANKQKILDAKLKQADDFDKKRKEFLENNKEPSDISDGGAKPKEKTPKTYDELAESILEEAKSKGESFIIPDV